MANLRKANLQTSFDGHLWIITNRQKTGTESNIRLLELAELFGTTAGAINAGIKAIIKSDTLHDYEVCKYVRLSLFRRFISE